MDEPVIQKTIETAPTGSRLNNFHQGIQGRLYRRSLKNPGAFAGRLFSPEQLDGLKESFNKNSYPSKEEFHSLAQKLNMKEKSVRMWFQNKRALLRKSKQYQVDQNNITSRISPLESPWAPVTGLPQMHFSHVSLPDIVHLTTLSLFSNNLRNIQEHGRGIMQGGLNQKFFSEIKKVNPGVSKCNTFGGSVPISKNTIALLRRPIEAAFSNSKSHCDRKSLHYEPKVARPSYQIPTEIHKKDHHNKAVTEIKDAGTELQNEPLDLSLKSSMKNEYGNVN